MLAADDTAGADSADVRNVAAGKANGVRCDPPAASREFDDDEVQLKYFELTYGKVLADDLRRWKQERKA